MSNELDETLQEEALAPDAPAEAAKPKNSRLRRAAAFFSVLVLVVVCVVVYLLRDTINLDALRRYVNYLDVSSSGEYGEFSYDYSASNAYGSFASGLAVASTTGVTLYSEKGTEFDTVPVSLLTPAVQTAGEYLLAYDAGGHALRVIHKTRGVKAEITADDALLDAYLASDGSFCYIDRSSGYKAVIHVYNDEQEQIYSWNSASGYYNACAVASGAEIAAASQLAVRDGAYYSKLVFFGTTSLEPLCEVELGSDMILDLAFLSGSTVCAIGENAVYFVSKDGKLRGTYETSPSYVLDYTLSGDGFLALCMNMYKAGDQISVVTVDAGGSELGNRFLGENVKSISACGRYLAVLTDSALTIYTSNLVEYARTEEIGAAVRVLMREDGTALLLENTAAHLYIP